jgi:hypothetical protein
VINVVLVQFNDHVSNGLYNTRIFTVPSMYMIFLHVIYIFAVPSMYNTRIFTVPSMYTRILESMNQNFTSSYPSL